MKSDLYVCEAGQNGCPKAAEPPKRNPNATPPTQTTNKPNPTDDKGDDDDKPQTDPDENMTPPPPSSSGPLCEALTDCCESLRVMGWTGSANQCLRTVREENESKCATEHETYKQPDEVYEPVCF